MRIGLDAREAFRQHPRGIGLYSRHLTQELGSLCPDDELWLYHEREAPPALEPLPRNARAMRVEMRGGRWHLWERVRMPWQIRRDRLALYHGTYNTLPPRWPPLGRGPALVVSIHDLIVTWWDDDLDDPYVRYCRQVTARVVRQADAILTASEWSKNDILERYAPDPAKVTVFHNGVHSDFLAGAPAGAGEQARARFAAGRRYVFAIGSRLARKQTGPMLDALGLLRERQRFDLAVLIAGLAPADQQPFRERAARAGLGDLVCFLPYVDRRDLIALYAGAELAIYPSLLEGWGVPVIEALALGTPVVTSRSSGMLEAGGAHARYCEPGDRESLAEAIADALERRAEFDRVRDAAVARARGFTWRRAAEVTLAAYRRVAGPRR